MGKLTPAERNIVWVEKNLRIPDGPKVGQPFVFSNWQQNEIIKIYDNPIERTRQAILSFARKNGKTALAAAILLLHFVGPESRQNAQMYSAARTREQAGIVYDYARAMILQTDELQTIIDLVRSRKEMRCDARGTYYRALSADAISAFGLNPLFVVHDELGQVRGPEDDLYDSLETAMGAQVNPLSLVISTQASSDDDLLSTLIDDALAGYDPSRIATVYTADDLDRDKDTEVDIEKALTIEGLEAANPALYEFMNVKELKKQMEQAKRMPARLSNFMNLNLNMRIEVNDPFVSKVEWNKCAGDLPAMSECVALYGGVDLSRTRDLTAFVVVGVKDGMFYVYDKFWMPAIGLKERSDSQRIPYFSWHKQGYIEATPGSIIDRQWVADYIFDTYTKTPLEKIAYDAWDYNHFVNNLERAGFPEWQVVPGEGDKDELLFEMFRQGYFSMSPALRTAEQLIVEGLLVHGNSPPLNFNIANAKVIRDTSGNRKLDKSQDKKTIDGAIAMVMALALAYQEHGDLEAEDFPLTSLFDDDDVE